MICCNFIERRCNDMKAPAGPFIDGQIMSTGNFRIELVNPATDAIFHEVSSANLGDVDRAVTSAWRTFEQSWRDMTPGKRREIMFAIARVIRDKAEELAQLDMQSI